MEQPFMLMETHLPTKSSAVRAHRVLHVLDHSWPVLSGYSIRSRGLMRGQLQGGLRPSAITGPLHELDDLSMSDLIVDGLSLQRTSLSGKVARRAIRNHWPVLREIAVISLLRKRILELVRQQSIDVIHAHSPALCGLAAWQAARTVNIPFVYEIRAFWEDAAVDQEKTSQQALRYQASRRLETYVVRNADAVVGIADSILQDVRKRGVPADRLFLVPNGVDGERLLPLPRDNKLAAELGLDSTPVLGFIGSLYRYEGLPWLVRAVAELRKQGLTCKLVIIGDGEDYDQAQTAIEETGSVKHVQLLGRIPHQEIGRYYSVIDVLVYPRRKNRLTDLVTPLKPLEAMACGKAVLGSRVGGIMQVVDDERTGLLFDPDDTDEFCRQARRLIEQKSLRLDLSSRGRQRVLEERDWKVLARQYSAIYDRVVHRTPLGAQAQS